jgi:hypothetical protein
VQLIISGHAYDVASVGKLTLLDLLDLKKQTGLDVDSLQAGLTSMDGKEGVEALSDERSLRALGALVWLTRRKAGESLTFEEACDFPLDEFEMVLEDDDPVAEEVPQ